jgi:prepilin-type N-terminal cleavage/methylation domain-containing protein
MGLKLRCRCQPGSQAGVTLLEMLVGLTLFALLMALLASSENFVLNAWRKGDEEVSRQRELNACLEVMLRQVRSAVPFKPPSTLRQATGFIGDPNRLTFVSALPVDQGGEPGLWLITYSLAPGGEEGGLLVAEQRQALDPAVWQGAAPAVEGISLLSGVTSLRFIYFQKDRRGEVLTPRETWLLRGTPRLPAAIQVEMEVRGRTLSWRLPVSCETPR